MQPGAKKSGDNKMEILKSQKHVFWEAFLVTILIFAIGVIAGVIFENWRVNKMDYLYKESEIAFSDIKAQGEIASSLLLDCNSSIEQNRVFADRIFKEAELLSRYDGAQALTEQIYLEHKKYDILRALLWSDSLALKKKCKADFNVVVYLYRYNTPSMDTKAKQGVFSRILAELKEDKGSEIVLVPLAGDNNLSSVSLMMDIYNVSESELPVILINEKTKVTELDTVEDIERLLK